MILLFFVFVDVHVAQISAILQKRNVVSATGCTRR